MSARWDPDESCRPNIDDAPVFYPTVEVIFSFKSKDLKSTFSSLSQYFFLATLRIYDVPFIRSLKTHLPI